MVQRLTNQVEKEQRDLQILLAVVENQPIGIGGLAGETGIPEHKVRYSLRMLENDGLVEPTPEGAIPTDRLAAEIEEINEGLDRLIDRLEGLKGTV